MAEQEGVPMPTNSEEPKVPETTAPATAGKVRDNGPYKKPGLVFPPVPDGVSDR
jgi:hypothetical protein